jgi:hypothetical protein
VSHLKIGSGGTVTGGLRMAGSGVPGMTMEYEYLSRVVGEVGSGGHTRAGGAIRMRVRGWVIGALRPVADGGSPVRAVTHPLGFTCLPMERVGPDGVCVHLWSPRIERIAPTTSPIHAHCWQLTSYALFGSLENRLMRVTDADADGHGADGHGADGHGADGHGADGAGASGDRDLYRVLEVRSLGDIDEFRPTSGLVRCVPGQRQVIGAGDVYSMSAGTFHSTEVRHGEEAATVALGRMVPGILDHSLGPPGTGSHRVRRRRCDAEQTAAAARIVLDRLLATSPCPA